MIKDIKGLTYRQWISALALGSAVGLISGCTRQWVMVDTPEPLVGLGIPEETSLAETEMYQDEFNRWYTSQIENWDAREAVAEEKAMFIDGLVGAIVNPENLASWGFNPYGGAGATFISLATMLAGNRSYRKGKEASYNAGLAKGKELAAGLEAGNG